MATVLAPLGSSPRSQRRYLAAARARGLYEKKNPGNAAEAIQWSSCRPEDEARALFSFMRRTQQTIEQTYALICVSDREFRELCLWAEDKPTVAGKIDAMMEFRDEVWRHFRFLVESHEGVYPVS
jgi:hypothetical protein